MRGHCYASYTGCQFVAGLFDYKLAVLTYKVHSITAPAPAYLSRHIKPRESAQTLYVRLEFRSSTNHSLGLSLLFDILRRRSGTHFLYLSSQAQVTICQYLNVG